LESGCLVMLPDWLLKGVPWLGGDSFPQTPRPDAFRHRRDRSKIRIANLTSLTGPAGIWGPSATNSTLLAVSEINRRGGILGREIEIVFHDAGGSIEEVVRTASDLVASDDADVIN
jgi:ABC-type branched-subunit amino acid transport system substrate-binding protein